MNPPGSPPGGASWFRPAGGGRDIVPATMVEFPQRKPIDRLLIVMPTWLGDCVMATPTLRAVRGLLPEARITAVLKKNVRPILDACPWVDRLVVERGRRRGLPDGGRRGQVGLARRLARGKFDTAILLPNSFRSAMVVSLAGVPRRIGYERDGRGFMLTDKLIPRKGPGGYVPVPTRDYYLGIARYLGAHRPDPAMELFTRPADDAAAEALLVRAGYDAAAGRPLVLLNPGANKLEKRWPAERFAAVADALAALPGGHGAAVAVTGSPKEREVLEGVVRAAKTPVLDLSKHGLDLTLLKSVVKRSSLLITNDTGPRHIAAALGTPVVTLFGPTGPEWTEIGFARERQVVASDRATMGAIGVESVVAAAGALLDGA